MKIQIMGYSGSGKSTTAKLLGKYYGVDLLYLDRVQFMEGWIEREMEEKLAILKDFLDGRDSWVIDGNYSSLYLDRRIEEADLIILLLFNRFSSLYRVTKRYFSNRGKTRESMAAGCPEKLDLEFIHWVLFEGRNKEKREFFRDIGVSYRDKTLVIKKQRELDDFLSKTIENKEK